MSALAQLIDKANRKTDAFSDALKAHEEHKDRFMLSQSIGLEIHQKTRLASHHAATMEKYDSVSPSRAKQKELLRNPEAAYNNEASVNITQQDTSSPFPSLRGLLVEAGRRSLSGAARLDDGMASARQSQDGQAQAAASTSARSMAQSKSMKPRRDLTDTSSLPQPRASESGTRALRASYSGRASDSGSGGGGPSAHEAVLSRIEQRWSNAGGDRRFSSSGARMSLSGAAALPPIGPTSRLARERGTSESGNTASTLPAVIRHNRSGDKTVKPDVSVSASTSAAAKAQAAQDATPRPATPVNASGGAGATVAEPAKAAAAAGTATSPPPDFSKASSAASAPPASTTRPSTADARAASPATVPATPPAAGTEQAKAGVASSAAGAAATGPKAH